VPTSLVAIGIAAVIAYQTVTVAIAPVPGLLGAVLSLGIGGLLLWMLLGTSYEIGETELVSRLGPCRFRVPLNTTEEVVLTRGFRLVGGLRLAWWLDMLRVKYRTASGLRTWTVSISSQDKTEFLQELAAVVPGLKVAGDGLEG
jgi:hypothetical protein